MILIKGTHSFQVDPLGHFELFDKDSHACADFVVLETVSAHVSGGLAGDSVRLPQVTRLGHVPQRGETPTDGNIVKISTINLALFESA